MKIYEYNEMMSYLTRPARVGFKRGTNFNRNPSGKNQWVIRTDAEIQKIIDSYPDNWTKKDFRGEGKLNKTPILTRKETERPNLKFKFTGKRQFVEPNKENIKRTAIIKKTQGSNISVLGSGQTGKQFSHVYPLIESAKPGTKTTTTIDAKMNRALEGYNRIGQSIAEEQELLIKTKPEGYKKKIVELNARAKKNVMNAVQELGKEYKGQIGYFQVDPDTGEFKPKAGNYKMSFAGIEGKNEIYKEMTGKERKNFERKISNIKQPKLKANMVPGLETLIKTVESMPNDFKARRYWTLGLKSLGIAAVPLVAYDGYTAIRDGLPPDEVVAKALLGADKLLYKGKEVLQLTPEEREARKVVQQAKMTEQIAEDFSGLDSDFYTPPIDSDLSVEEAEAKWKEGQERYADFREKKDAARAGKRKDIWTAITDPQEILSREISAATGGRVGFDEGSKPKSPGRRAFIKGITALAALPIVGKYFKLGKVLSKAGTYTGPAIQKIKGMPEWFPSLVKKLYTEGEDVTKQVAYKERQVVKRGTLEGGDDVDMIYDLDTGDVSIDVTPKKGTYETSSGAYNKEYSLEYTKGQADEMTKGKPPDEFEVAELEGRADPNAILILWQ
jgi:hypothetical protein